MKIFESDKEDYYLIFEKEPKTGLTLWAVFDTSTRTFKATGFSEKWDDAAVHAREVMRGNANEAKNP
jgi:hypothetical protein